MSRPGGRPLRRGLKALTALLLVGVVAASPAGADPAGPSDFRSEVTGIVPAAEGLKAEIRGGDSFLEVDVAPGHTAVIKGYSGEPYLRILEDGTVERNRLSSATYLNNDRQGRVDIPADAKAATKDGAEPDWERVGGGGTYAWHDHRVHWMGGASPPVGRGETVKGFDPWTIPVTVDGTDVEIHGTLFYEDAVSPVPWAVLALVIGGVLAWFGRRPGLRLGAAALSVASAVALVVGRADWVSTPQGGGNPLLWALPAFALVTALVALVWPESGRGVVAALASVASLSGWALFRIQVLLKPVLPTALPFALDRATVAVALGASVAVAYLAVTSGALALPALEDD